MDIQIRLVIFFTYNSSPSESESPQSSFLEIEVKKVELFIILSQDKTRELRRLDTKLHGLIKYLDTGILPQNQKEARCILLESSNYKLINGHLWHSRVPSSKRTQYLDNYRRV